MGWFEFDAEAHKRAARRQEGHEPRTTGYRDAESHETPSQGLATDDRRTAQRYPARLGGVTVAWFDERGWAECHGEIGDISMGGALIWVGRLPPADSPVWIRLDAVGHADWVEVIAVEGRKDPQGRHALRVAFAAGCPYLVFRTAVWGRLQDDFSASSVAPRSPHVNLTHPHSTAK